MKDRLGRLPGIKEKTNKIADIMKRENPDQLLQRYIKDLEDMRIILVRLQNELKAAQSAWGDIENE